MARDNLIAQSVSYDYGGLPPEQIEEAKAYAEGRKISEDIHAKGGNLLFHASNIREEDPVKPRLLKWRRRPYRWVGDLGLSVFDPAKEYENLMDLFTKNPPIFTLTDRAIMVPEDSLFDDLYSGLCESGLGDGISKDNVFEFYMRGIGNIVWFSFLSRAAERGFIKDIKIIDIERGMPHD